MGMTINQIAQKLKNSRKKINLIYAFNGEGKTRLSREFKSFVESSNYNSEDINETDILNKQVLYYNAFTEDLFYWDNDLEFESKPELRIQPNSFTKWILSVQGGENDIADKFKKYTDSKLTPNFNEDCSKVKFSYEHGDENSVPYVKISKGEESNFVWCVFNILLDEIVAMREDSYEDIQLKYVFIDDPVTSLDDNHLIRLAVDLACLAKKGSKYGLKFIFTTHNPLFYNVLYNEFSRYDTDNNYKGDKDFLKYRMKRLEDGTFMLVKQKSDSPFSYHLFLIKEIKNAIKTGRMRKYHFNFLRNILEKSATFLGYKNSVELLPKNSDGKPDPYDIRMINISSHSKHSGEEVSILTKEEKKSIKRIFNHLISNHNFGEGYKDV
jgi:wobble nucleotide-excising tRNase